MKTGKLCNAFSMIEVAIALGIASFGLLAVVGLLPVGIDSVKTSREEAAAAKCIEQIAIAIRSVSLDSNGVYTIGGDFAELSWSDGAGVLPSKYYNDITFGGFRTPDDADRRLAAWIEITPPLGSEPGKALVSVAWPSHATWSKANKKWLKSSGSLSTWLTILPQS